MTRKPTTPIVYADDLPKPGLEYVLVRFPSRIKLHIPAGRPHAIVRNGEYGSDIGIVLYEKENGLPYAVYDSEAQYLFWGDNSELLHARRVSKN